MPELPCVKWYVDQIDTKPALLVQMPLVTTPLFQLILSVSGRGKKSLEDTTWFIMNRFKKGGVSADLKPDYQIRVALLVCH